MARRQNTGSTAKRTKRTSGALKKPAVRVKHSDIWRGIRARRPLHKKLAMHPLSMFALLCTGVLLFGLTMNAHAVQTIKSTVEAPPLLAPATINAPSDGATVRSQPITVTGTCPNDSYMKLDVNGAFEGVAWCEANNTYSITASLYPGSNTVAVQDYNITDLPGPHTDPITLTYDAPVPTTGGTAGSNTPSGAAGTGSGSSQAPVSSAQALTPLLLTSTFNFEAFTVGKTFSWKLDLEGGVPPYSVHTDWGDGGSSNLDFKTSQVFTVSHQYAKAGYFPIRVTVSDAKHQVKVMQLAALIKTANGDEPFLSTQKPNTPAGPNSSSKQPGSSSPFKRALPYLWPAYGILLLMVVSFWLGEVQEYQHTRKRHA